MANQSHGRTTFEDARNNNQVYLISAARDGYNDVLHNRGFSAYYDRSPEWYQQNYERGRLWATSFIASGLKVPRWRRDSLTPPKVINMINYVCNLGGLPSVPLPIGKKD